MIIFSTVQVQDISDQEGDYARGRRTLPLVIGGMPTRWSIVFPLPIWSLLASAFWQLDLVIYVLPLTLSALVSMRILRQRAVADDKITFRMWNAWILTVYVLPIIRTTLDIL